MNIDALHQEFSTRTSPRKSDFSSTDWRPASTLARKRKRAQRDVFLRSQEEKLLQLRGALVSSMAGVARDTRADNSDSSALSTHNGDAGSDACDRDFALALLSQEKNALFEIDQALRRIEMGTYGICEMSKRRIPISRLEAIPFTRFTVECQAEIEKLRKSSLAQRSTAFLIGVAGEESLETEESPWQRTEM